MFGVNSNIWVISLIRKEWRNTGSSTQSIIVGMGSVVATTCWNGTRSLLTSAKLSVSYLVVGITRELDKELSLYCYPIYISYKWFVLQQCVCLMFTPQ